MKKDNVMFGVFGLIVGLVIGFVVANNINRSAAGRAPAATVATQTSGDNPALPPDHPPIGTTGGQAPGAAMVPQVSAAIEKAKAEPQNFDSQMDAANLYNQVERFQDAAPYCEAAAKLASDDAARIVKVGNCYFDAEKYEQAETWYLQALKKDPRNVDVRTDLGLSYFLREPRDVEGAIKQYQASLAIDPNHEITLQNLAIAYSEKGDSAGLAQTLERLKKVNPNNPVFQKNAGK